MLPLVVLGAAAWYLSRPQRNPDWITVEGKHIPLRHGDGRAGDPTPYDPAKVGEKGASRTTTAAASSAGTRDDDSSPLSAYTARERSAYANVVRNRAMRWPTFADVTDDKYRNIAQWEADLDYVRNIAVDHDLDLPLKQARDFAFSVMDSHSMLRSMDILSKKIADGDPEWTEPSGAPLPSANDQWKTYRRSIRSMQNRDAVLGLSRLVPVVQQWSEWVDQQLERLDAEYAALIAKARKRKEEEQQAAKAKADEEYRRYAAQRDAEAMAKRAANVAANSRLGLVQRWEEFASALHPSLHDEARQLSAEYERVSLSNKEAGFAKYKELQAIDRRFRGLVTRSANIVAKQGAAKEAAEAEAALNSALATLTAAPSVTLSGAALYTVVSQGAYVSTTQYQSDALSNVYVYTAPNRLIVAGFHYARAARGVVSAVVSQPLNVIVRAKTLEEVARRFKGMKSVSLGVADLRGKPHLTFTASSGEKTAIELSNVSLPRATFFEEQKTDGWRAAVVGSVLTKALTKLGVKPSTLNVFVQRQPDRLSLALDPNSEQDRVTVSTDVTGPAAPRLIALDPKFLTAATKALPEAGYLQASAGKHARDRAVRLSVGDSVALIQPMLQQSPEED